MGRDMGFEPSSKPSKVRKMNSRFKASFHNMVNPTKSEKEKTDTRGSRVTERGNVRRSSSRERKIALQQDVDKLTKKLRHEENVHRALERAFTRPLGALPRLPPYLPQYTLELLAEVAVLEEEVVRLEEQVVTFRKGLYREAVYISTSSSSKKQMENGTRECLDHSPGKPNKLQRSFSQGNPNAFATKIIENFSLHQSSVDSFSSNGLVTGKKALNRGSFLDGKENQLQPNSTRNKQSPQRISRSRPLVMEACSEQGSPKKQEITKKLQMEIIAGHEKSAECKDNVRRIANEDRNKPTKLSEDILKCLLSIFTRIALSGGCASNIDGSLMGSLEKMEARDPYGVCDEFGERDVGPYKYLSMVSSASIDPNRISNAAHLIRKLKQLLVILGSVDLRGLTHQQKLAFWINVYNSCMMNAFLEYGIPDRPHKIVELMHKAVLSVGGHMLNALTIEHFILRLPYHSKHVHLKGGKTDESTMRSIFGLDWPEPLVTFALSCGSWSSPAVRIYTAENVEEELESAKKEFLQAAVGISTRHNKLSIPKLLDWYLLDFAKDVDSLLDWICLQLPSPLRKEAVKCLERGRNGSLSQAVQIVPYEFSFRYILVT